MTGLHHLLALVCLASVAPGHLRSKIPQPCAYNMSNVIENTPSCIRRIKAAAASTRMFWFGEQWDAACVGSSEQHSIRCYNPENLRKYRSLGSRLLRVPSFDLAYLRNLKILPRMTFVSEPGSFCGCEHVFHSDQGRVLGAQPDMEAARPWHLRKLPQIQWPNMHDQFKSYTLLLVDVGFGYLHYLAYNFPANTSTLKSYSGPLNFRSDQPNPYALLVFEQPTGHMSSLEWQTALFQDATIDLQKFILSNAFQQNLVGLNWVQVDTDAYAIEKQRIRNNVDNCHSLIKQKLFSAIDNVKLPFIPYPSLSKINRWMTITYKVGQSKFSVCCQSHYIPASDFTLDPLGDSIVLPVHTRLSPTVTVASIQQSPLYTAYRRQSRDYVALLDVDLYTLMMVDNAPDDRSAGDSVRPLAHWLVTDIPGSALANGYIDGLAGKVQLDYFPPMPTDNRMHRFVFLLFRQNDGPINYKKRHFTPKHCPQGLEARCLFNVESLMARHALSLDSVSWLRSHTDSYVHYNLVQEMGEHEQNVCVRFGLEYSSKCKASAQFSRSPNCASCSSVLSFILLFCTSVSILERQWL